ncbi:UDP-N-acetylmuramate dehydrogenase [Candidatus Kaiserbacteria bacterium]|nr:UDP-N-acetylmuramate dehydrogenase [Candidatus Kaiserbacteria bacterium]
MIEIKEHVPLASLTTFEIGGNARYFAEAKNENDIQDAMSWAKEHGKPYIILAGGSNVLVPDEGIEGLVINIVSQKFDISETGVHAEAGCNLLQLIRSAADAGLGGWEKLGGIPGTIGGAVRGNAGAFGPEIKDFVTWVRALDVSTGEIREFSNPECEFSYRMSHFKKHPELIIFDIHLQLQKMNSAESHHHIEETIQDRERRHIQNVRAAGSFFMNPVVPDPIREMFEKEKQVKSREGRVPAGWLIEKAGMKGARVGGAEASVQHPNYLVNADEATESEVKELAEQIRKAVFEKFGVTLTEEAVVW